MKQNFEDMKPIKRKKTVETPIAVSVPKIDKPLFKNLTHSVPLINDIDNNFENNDKKEWNKVILKVAISIAIIGSVLYGLSFTFRGAKISLSPKTIHGTVNQTLKAVKDQNSASSALSYQVMTVSDSVTKKVVATKTDVVSTKASGTVIIYNNQSSPQKLITQTRFADSKGAIYRLKNAVTIPKKYSKDGVLVPGSIEAIVEADVPGALGNIDLSDFTVVSFTGTEKGKLVYARSKAAFTGGASGSVYFLEDSEYKGYAGPMLEELDKKLRSQSIKQVPEGYVLIPESLQVVLDSDKNKNILTNEKADLNLVVSGKIRGIIIKQADLENIFISSVIPDQKLSTKEVKVHGINDLTYKILSPLDQNIFSNPVSIQVTGKTDIVWNVDKNSVINSLLGISQKDFSSKMQTFGSIDQAELMITPFWVYVIPKDPTKIDIEIKDTFSK